MLARFVRSCFLPTQSKSLFGEDMNTQNSDFGGLNVKHDELKSENTFFHVVAVAVLAMEMMVKKTTSSSILKTHKTQRNRKKQETSSSLCRPKKNRNQQKRCSSSALTRKPSFLFFLILLLAKISDPKDEENMLISIIIHDFPGRHIIDYETKTGWRHSERLKWRNEQHNAQ